MLSSKGHPFQTFKDQMVYKSIHYCKMAGSTEQTLKIQEEETETLMDTNLKRIILEMICRFIRQSPKWKKKRGSQ